MHNLKDTTTVVSHKLTPDTTNPADVVIVATSTSYCDTVVALTTNLHQWADTVLGDYGGVAALGPKPDVVTVFFVYASPRTKAEEELVVVELINKTNVINVRVPAGAASLKDCSSGLPPGFTADRKIALNLKITDSICFGHYHTTLETSTTAAGTLHAKREQVLPFLAKVILDPFSLIHTLNDPERAIQIIECDQDGPDTPRHLTLFGDPQRLRFVFQWWAPPLLTQVISEIVTANSNPGTPPYTDPCVKLIGQPSPVSPSTIVVDTIEFLPAY